MSDLLCGWMVQVAGVGKAPCALSRAHGGDHDPKLKKVLSAEEISEVVLAAQAEIKDLVRVFTDERAALHKRIDRLEGYVRTLTHKVEALPRPPATIGHVPGANGVPTKGAA